MFVDFEHEGGAIGLGILPLEDAKGGIRGEFSTYRKAAGFAFLGGDETPDGLPENLVCSASQQPASGGVYPDDLAIEIQLVAGYRCVLKIVFRVRGQRPRVGLTHTFHSIFVAEL